MMKPLTARQKLIAYSSLVMVIICTALGIFTFWLYLAER